jgi:hypothetical protein
MTLTVVPELPGICPVALAGSAHPADGQNHVESQ